MIIQEKLRAISSDNDTLLAGRLHHVEAPQQPPKLTLPYAVFYAREEPLRHQNSGLSRTRVWIVEFYAHHKNSLLANEAARSIKSTFCLYKETAAGMADTEIQAITLENGIEDLERDAQKNLCCCAVILKVTENIGA